MPKKEEKEKILVIEDEASIRELLTYLFEHEGYVVKTAATGTSGLEQLDNEEFDLIVQDMRLPDMDGISLLNTIKKNFPDALVVIITAFSHWKIAVEAMRLGAFDYVKKPFDNKNIKAVVQRALKQKSLLQYYSKSSPHCPQMVGNSTAVQKIQDLIRRVAPTDSTVLINGESGTGKELVARSIYTNSLRQGHVFIPINCGALSENLLESELFGHVKGAFTSAIRDKKGLFEVAHEGTLFFDEIGEMSLTTQAKLLRAIEDKQFIPLGDTSPKYSDVRFIAATNRDLEEMSKRGEFREDLFYRLNVIPIEVPALRYRKEDVPLLAGHLLALYASKIHKYVSGFTPEAMDLLMQYKWPGNVRELSNLIQRAVVLCEGDVIEKEHLSEYSKIDNQQQNSYVHFPDEGVDLEAKLSELEKYYVEEALKKTQGNLTQAAKLLSLTFRSLRYKVKKYEIKTIDHKI